MSSTLAARVAYGGHGKWLVAIADLTMEKLVARYKLEEGCRLEGCKDNQAGP